MAVIVFFIVPAILDGRSPTAVAFVGALAIMLITLPPAPGAGPKTIAASLGTAASLSLTLVLAYAGASLPVLLIFSLADTPFADAINLEAVAEAVVATLVGSIGLIAAVPITTALAALLASNMEPAALAEAGHAH